MDKLQLVSVIIPVYNRFDLLERTLLSIKAQDYSNYELILIDDCSNIPLDINTIKAKFINQTFLYDKLEENSGPGIARKRGRELASGEYIAYLDSDDFWQPQFLSKTVLQLEMNADVSMVFTNVLIKNGDKQRKRLSLNDGLYNFYDLIFSGKKYWATGAAVWRADVSLSANWKAIRDHEDYVHDILSLQLNPKIFHLSETLCIVNKNALLGIKRSNIEMLKGLRILINSKTLLEQLRKTNQSQNFVDFVLVRMAKRNYKLQDFRLVFKLYTNLLKWPYSNVRMTKRFSRILLKKIKLGVMPQNSQKNNLA